MGGPNSLQEANGGAGVYSADMRKNYQLQDPQWRHDMVPEIMDGHNVLDFVDPDIEAQLAALEREEEELAAAAAIEVGCGFGGWPSTLAPWGASVAQGAITGAPITGESLLSAGCHCWQHLQGSSLSCNAMVRSSYACCTCLTGATGHAESQPCSSAKCLQCSVCKLPCVLASLPSHVLATALQGMEMDLGDAEALNPEERELLKRIRARRKVVVAEHRLKKGTSNNQAVLPRNADRDHKSTTSQMRVSALRPSLLQLQPVQAQGLCELGWGSTPMGGPWLQESNPQALIAASKDCWAPPMLSAMTLKPCSCIDSAIERRLHQLQADCLPATGASSAQQRLLLLLLHSSFTQRTLVEASDLVSAPAAGGLSHTVTLPSCRHPSRAWASTPPRPWSGRGPSLAGASAPGTSRQRLQVAMWTWQMPSPRSASTAASPGAQALQKQG